MNYATRLIIYTVIKILFHRLILIFFLIDYDLLLI